MDLDHYSFKLVGTEHVKRTTWDSGSLLLAENFIPSVHGRFAVIRVTPPLNRLMENDDFVKRVVIRHFWMSAIEVAEIQTETGKSGANSITAIRSCKVQISYELP